MTSRLPGEAFQVVSNPMHPLDSALVVVAKRPAAGQTKTRLCPPLSPAAAARLYAAFLEDSLALARQLARQAPQVKAALAYMPPEANGYFASLAPDFIRIPQQGDSLGERLDHVLAHFLGRGCRHVVVISSDSPTLPVRYLFQAFRALQDGADAVLGPCEDGGYYLIGLRQRAPRLLCAARLSTPYAAADTLALAAEAGLKTACLSAWYDVDDEAGLQRLLAGLAASTPETAAHTRACLAQYYISPDSLIA